MPPGRKLSSAASVKGSQPNNDKVFPCQTVSNMKMETELKAAISPSLNKYNGKVILDALFKYPDVFNEGLGYTDVITHKIDTSDTAPIRQYPRRFPYAYREEVNKPISEMFEQGVIQLSNFPWASPIVLVKKKDGKFCFCVDYHQLNAARKGVLTPSHRLTIF